MISEDLIMAKKKDLELSDLLTKLSPIFPSDLCIVNGQDVVEGNISYDKTNGHCSCILSVEAMTLIGKLYPDTKYIYIKDVKKAKKEPDIYITTDKKNIPIDDIEDRRKTHLSNYTDIDNWNQLQITDDLIENIFNGNDVSISIPDYNGIEINLSKSLLPTITQKNIHELKYAASRIKTGDLKEKIIAVVFLMDQPLFTLYMNYSYLVC